MASSTSHLDDEKKPLSIRAGKLLGFSELPNAKNITVSPTAKKTFEAARDGQGFIIIAWKNGGELVIELIPGFNRGDGKPRTKKDGTTYGPDEMVISQTTINWYTGTNHQDGILLLKRTGQIPSDIDEKEILGAGLFKGNAQALLDKFMNRSLFINGKSIEYDEELMLASYYKNAESHFVAEIQLPTANFPFYNEFNIRRSLPQDITELIYQALQSQLQTPGGPKGCIVKDRHESIASAEKWWLINQKNPQAKNAALMETIFIASRIDPKPERLGDVVKYIDKNILELSKQSIFQTRSEVLNTKPLYGDGLTALMVAAQAGHRLMVQALIAAGAPIATKDDKAGNTALMWAIMNGHTEVANQIIQDDKKGESLLVQNTDGNSALMLALESQKPRSKEIVEMLLTCYPTMVTKMLNQKNKYGATTLYVALGCGKDLPIEGIDLVPTFYYAIKNNHTIIINKLLDELKANIHQCDTNENNLLHIAARFGSSDTINLLCEKKAQIDINHVNEDEETPLMIAVQNGNADALRVLLLKGARTNETLLHLAAKKGNLAVLTILLSAKSNPNIKDRKGDSPLHLAIQSGNGEIAKGLIDAGAMLDAKNKKNQTPFQMAQIISSMPSKSAQAKEVMRYIACKSIHNTLDSIQRIDNPLKASQDNVIQNLQALVADVKDEKLSAVVENVSAFKKFDSLAQGLFEITNNISAGEEDLASAIRMQITRIYAETKDFDVALETLLGEVATIINESSPSPQTSSSSAFFKNKLPALSDQIEKLLEKTNLIEQYQTPKQTHYRADR